MKIQKNWKDIAVFYVILKDFTIIYPYKNTHGLFENDMQNEDDRK